MEILKSDTQVVERESNGGLDSLFGGHLGLKKTEDRIQNNLFWPGLHNDVTSFCPTCDVFRKTVSRVSIGLPRDALGDMPMIDQPFKRVAII